MQPPNIHQRILGIMSDVDYIEKEKRTVNGQYRFVSHDSVTAKLHPYLVKHGVTAIPTVTEQTQDGNRTTAKVVTIFTNVDNPLDSIAVTYYGYGVDGSDKGPGKAVSYAFKYALLKTFNLETGDDPDNDANASYEPPKCLEFDLAIKSDFDESTCEKIRLFVEECAQASGKHVEDIKREAVKRMDKFIEAFKKKKK